MTHKKLLLRALLFTIILFTYIRLQQSQTWWSHHRWKLHTCSFLIPWALSHLCADTDGWWCSTENLCSYLKQSAPQLRCFARRQLEWWFPLLAIWRSVEVSRFHSTLLWCFYFPGRASVCQFLVYAPGLHLEVFNQKYCKLVFDTKRNYLIYEPPIPNHPSNTDCIVHRFFQICRLLIFEITFTISVVCCSGHTKQV